MVRVPDAGDFISRAVSEGLADDGVPPSPAVALAKHDEDFVKKCSIREPTHNAQAKYAKRTDAPAAKDGKGLPGELVKRLKSDADDTRRAALRELVRRYVEQSYAKLDRSAEQKAALQTKLDELRKAATGGLPAGQKLCPPCDGAACRTPKG